MFMRRLAGLVTVAVIGLYGSGVASAQILNSEHDFSNNGFAQGEICIVCHTPHNSDTSVSDAPLWDHELSTATYTLYSNPSLQGTVTQPAGVTKLCLSCHDGTVAIDSFGGATGTNTIGGGANVGTNLDDDHPVSVTYEFGTDPDLKDPTTFTAARLFSNQVECSSCHNVHNESGVDGLLVMSNADSALCSQCHSK